MTAQHAQENKAIFTVAVASEMVLRASLHSGVWCPTCYSSPILQCWLEGLTLKLCFHSFLRQQKRACTREKGGEKLTCFLVLFPKKRATERRAKRVRKWITSLIWAHLRGPIVINWVEYDAKSQWKLPSPFVSPFRVFFLYSFFYVKPTIKFWIEKN